MAVQVGLAEILNGSQRVTLKAHLAISPLSYPYHLLDFHEADWLGYSAAALVPVEQYTDQSGYVLNVYQVSFANYDILPRAIDGIYITANIDEEVRLLMVLQRPAGGWPAVPFVGLTLHVKVQTIQGA